MKRGTFLTLGLALLCGAAPAAEVTTNGTGGGMWTDPATWRGKAVPKPQDEVTIRKGDDVVFDRNDDSKTTCAKLFIDPQGALRFKTGAGKVVFVVAGPVESFGTMKLDGAASADDLHEFRLTGKTPEERSVKFDKGSGLVVSGKAGLPGGRHNARIVSRAPDPKAADVSAAVEVKAGTLDVLRADFEDVQLKGTEIDNTGDKPGERVNVRSCRFHGNTDLSLASCDSPVVTDNTLEYPGGPWHMPPAILLNGCPLAEVKNNAVKGSFYYAFNIYGCTDAAVAGNSTDGPYIGIYCVGTAAFKGNKVRGAGGGQIVTSFTGTVEDAVFEKCGYGIDVAGATVQLTNCAYRDPPKAGHAVEFAQGEVTLINCDFGPDAINLPKPLPPADKPRMTAMQYLVLKVNGTLPEDAQIDVRTVGLNLAAGAADPNVRNVPAPLVGNRTPLPQSLSPILVQGWSIDKDGKTQPAPEYTVRVLAPAEGDKEPKVLKALTVKPDAKWYRPKPNDPAPTLEVSLP
jgi:hypothetical protein